MDKIAVHLHIYYENMWETIKDYLRNIDMPYDLYVTMNRDNQLLQEEIKAFHEQTLFYVVPNRGYDVAPFIYFLNHIDCEGYDIIIKIHTKNNTSKINLSINYRMLTRPMWFELLFSSLLGDESVFHKNIEAFQNDPRLGMIGSKYLIVKEHSKLFQFDQEVKKLLNEMGYKIPTELCFVAGTMFMVRGKLLKRIFQKFHFDDFAMTDGHVRDGTLAHILERLFGSVVCAEGYKVNGFDKNTRIGYMGRLRYFFRFIYQTKDTTKGYRVIKILKIPVFHQKVVK